MVNQGLQLRLRPFVICAAPPEVSGMWYLLLKRHLSDSRRSPRAAVPRQHEGRGRIFQMAQRPAQIIACHDCDLLQREIPLNPGCTASCIRCGAILYRNATDSIDRTLAYSLAAAAVFVVANIYPIFAIEMKGDRTAINLIGAVRSLWNQDMRSISVVVGLTTILIPALELISMIYLLLPLKFLRLPAGYTFLLRTMRCVEPWGMVEVFMLGVLVSLVKLTSSFKVIPGISLYSFGVLTLLLAAAAASFSARDVWARLESVPGLEVTP
jgi:paraquat-inducible protein A